MNGYMKQSYSRHFQEETILVHCFFNRNFLLLKLFLIDCQQFYQDISLTVIRQEALRTRLFNQTSTANHFID